MTERNANETLAVQATEAEQESARVAAWVARNPPRKAHPRPSLIVRILRALGF